MFWSHHIDVQDLSKDKHRDKQTSVNECTLVLSFTLVLSPNLPGDGSLSLPKQVHLCMCVHVYVYSITHNPVCCTLLTCEIALPQWVVS